MIKKILWSAALGLALGWLAGVIEFLIYGCKQVMGGAKEAIISLVYISAFYSFVWFVLLFIFSLSIIALSYLTGRWRGFSEKFLDLDSHLLGAGSALFIYFYFLMPINNRLLPSARDPESIIGNLFYIIICIFISFIFYFVFRKLSRVTGRLNISAALRHLTYSVCLIAIINMLVITVASPKDWLLCRENEELKADATPRDINVILITIDALRPDHLSCYGYHRPTPTIDSLAHVGHIFDQAIAQSPWTLPSFISMMTSLYPEAVSNCEMVPLDPARVTLAEVLSANGIRTAAILSNLFLVNLYNITQGFEYVSHAYQQPVWVRNLVGSQLYNIIGELNAKLFLREDAEILTIRAVDWLKENQEESFFLWVHYMEPHVPYGDPWNDLWPPDPEYDGKIGNQWDDFGNFCKGLLKLDDADAAHLEYLYDGDILYVDFHLKKLFDHLKQEKLWDRTLIILTADHGEEFLEHGQLTHGTSVYDELVRVPLIMKLPDQRTARPVSLQVQLLDLAPTVLDILGLPETKEMTGKSILPVIRGEEKKSRPAFCSCNKFGSRLKSIRYDNYSLIYNEDKQILSLFNREDDPSEYTDIYKTDREKANQLWGLLKNHREKNIFLFNQMEKLWAEKKVQLSETEKQRLRAIGYIE